MSRGLGNLNLKVNSLWMLSGQILRAGVQFAYFALLARSLGAAQYGSFITVVATLAILAPFASWGSGNILVQEVARDRQSFGKYWGAALATTLTASSLLIILFLAFGRLLFPETNIYIILFLATSELLLARLIDVSGQAFQSIERLDRTSYIQLLPSFLRLIMVIILYILPFEKSAINWSLLYFVATLIGAVISIWLVWRDLGWGSLSFNPMSGKAGSGFLFAISLGAQNVYNDIDKVMLARLVSNDAAGIYAAAYKIIDAGFTPVRSILFSSYAKFFKAGQEGPRGTVLIVRKLLPVNVMYSFFAAILIYFCSPLAGIFFGEQFANSELIIKLLAPLIILKSIHYFIADALTGAGLQFLRSGAQIFVMLINIGLNVIVLPKYGVLGAAYVSIFSDMLLAVILGVVFALRIRSKR